MEIRIEGVLKSWNKERGFGFIEPLSGGGQDIFVHASDFPRQGGAPRPGERLTFEIGLNAEGKKKALQVRRPGQRRRASAARSGSLLGKLLAMAALAVLGVGGYKFFVARSTSAVSLYRCDGRTYCAQMGSCKEAKYFLKNCPGTQMDGDGDGKPCEAQWCTGFLD